MEVAASGVVHGTELRYLTLAGTAYAPPAEPPLDRLLGFLDEVGPAWRMPARIDYYAFPDRETLRALTGWDTNGRAILAHDATTSIHAADAHEVMHLLTTPTARPLRLAGLWMEGIAMHYTWPEVYFDAATDTAAVLAAFERHLGVALVDAETAWHAFLDGWDEAAAE